MPFKVCCSNNKTHENLYNKKKETKSRDLFISMYRIRKRKNIYFSFVWRVSNRFKYFILYKHFLALMGNKICVQCA